MSYMKLIKLLYLADREALARWGRPITTDTYFSMSKGPVLSHILDLIDEGPPPEEEPSFWAQHIISSGNYEVSLKEDPNDDLLSEAEEELLDSVFQSYGCLNRWKLVDLVHKFPEWRDPQGGALPLEYGDILKALNKRPEEITAIVEELDQLARVDALCSAH